ncbi:sodium/proline symporter PutP [Endozoicomonas numazuensis]|uniref:Sodium/proline symporter n=1 Tax=Endozoicomonas numazuensis TaxID=1137799 RepID=A0A081NEU4_9GAMM|nr:sodium/proline symporter PutP [Endozoicomonas numazuensis]KEQ16967.1 proline:sodium symporter PutP [Endozoicomonas numazuensis]
MITNTFATIVTFVVYLAMMLMIGLWAWKRTANSEDYFLGGRSLGPWPAALSAGASDMSGWLLLGLPGYAFASGVEAFWLAGGLLIGTWLNWLLLARRLRVYSEASGNALTLPEFFTNRFRDTSKMLQVVSAFFILLFFLFYTSSGLVAGGKLFETVFGLDYTWAVIIGTLCVISYTLFGGFLAVSWTDLVQGLLMAAAMVIVPVIALQTGNTDTSLFEQLRVHNAELLNPFTTSSGEALGWMAIVSLMTWGLGYFGQPHILARFAGIRSEKDVPTARRIAVGWSAISMLGAIMVGLIGLLYINEMDLSLGDGETIFMVMVNALFHPVVAGILLAAILAAIMSTADSQLLVSSSALAEDFYKAVLRKDADQKEVLMVGRLAVILIALVALTLAMSPDSSVLGLVSYAWAGFGAAFGPALLMSLYWKRMNRNGALAGIIVGGVTVVLWKQVSGGIFDLYEIVPGMLFAFIAIVGVSLNSSEPKAEIIEEFDEVEKALA